jgi:predicted HNH restriction endonuclease
MVCGFSFAETYGNWGEGFIEVHHLRAISEGRRKTDPSMDLAVLCANCHRMIHRKRDIALTLEELKGKLRS